MNTINEKAVEYGTCNLQQISKIDMLIGLAVEQAWQEARGKVREVVNRYKNSYPRPSGIIEMLEEI